MKNTDLVLDKPLVSIITIVYNGCNEIEDTILSVINQTYNNYEYIIIDGNSNDGTVEIIKKYSDKIKYWVSEPDSGIYDAMNKGIKKASGQWINFLNSGDKYADNCVISDISSNLLNNYSVDIYYGNSFAISKSNRIKHFIAGEDPKKQWKGPIFRHGAMFVNLELQKAFLYKTSNQFKICSDFDFIYHMLISNKIFKKINRDILYFSEGGISSSRIQCTKDNKMIVLHYSPKVIYAIWHNIWILRAFVVEKVIIPLLSIFTKI